MYLLNYICKLQYCFYTINHITKTTCFDVVVYTSTHFLVLCMTMCLHVDNSVCISELSFLISFLVAIRGSHVIIPK